MEISGENRITAMVHGTYACVCILEYVLLIHRSVGSGALLATLMIMIDQPVPPSVSLSQKSGYTVTYHSVPRFLPLYSVIRIHEVSGAGEQEFKLQVAAEQNYQSRVLSDLISSYTALETAYKVTISMPVRGNL